MAEMAKVPLLIIILVSDLSVVSPGISASMESDGCGGLVGANLELAKSSSESKSCISSFVCVLLTLSKLEVAWSARSDPIGPSYSLILVSRLGYSC